MSPSYAEPRVGWWDPAFTAHTPRDRVFDYVADPRHRPRWQASLRRVELLDAGPPRVGLRWVDHLYGGVRFQLAIVAMEPPRLWAESGRIGPVTAYLTVLVEDAPDGTGTRVQVAPRLTAPGLARPLGWIATAVMNVLVRTDLPRLRRQLESLSEPTG